MGADRIYGLERHERRFAAIYALYTELPSDICDIRVGLAVSIPILCQLTAILCSTHGGLLR